MSSIMRRRSGLMGFSLIGVLLLEVEVVQPLDPQNRTPGLSPRPAHLVTPSAQRAPLFARSALPRKRVRSLAQPGSTGRRPAGPLIEVNPTRRDGPGTAAQDPERTPWGRSPI